MPNVLILGGVHDGERHDVIGYHGFVFSLADYPKLSTEQIPLRGTVPTAVSMIVHRYRVIEFHSEHARYYVAVPDHETNETALRRLIAGYHRASAPPAD